jgi:hypothetical protein
MIPSNCITLTALALAVSVSLAAPFSKRSQFTGVGTWYGAGVSIGNCGWQSSGTESVVALNTAQYGSTDEISPYCGQTVTISYNGMTKQATVVDSCPTCFYGDLDLSKSLFSAFTGNDLDLGVIQIQWSFGTSNDVPAVPTPPNVVSPAAIFPAAATLAEAAPTTIITLQPTQTTAAATTTPSPSSTTKAIRLQTSTPQWWAVLGTGSCPDVILPAGMDPVAVSPSKLAGVDELPAACGKTLQITNPAMNLTTVAMLTNYYIGGEPNNTIFMNSAYLKIAKTASTFEGILPYKIDNVTWGFLD